MFVTPGCGSGDFEVSLSLLAVGLESLRYHMRQMDELYNYILEYNLMGMIRLRIKV